MSHLSSGPPSPKVRPTRWTDALAIGAIAAVPPWLVGLLITWSALRLLTPGSGPHQEWSDVPWLQTLLGPMVSTGLVFVTVWVMQQRGKFRADLTWAAAGLFVLDGMLADVIVLAPTSGDAIAIQMVISTLSGHWLLMFVAGGLAWRRRAPTFAPVDWSHPEESGDE